MGDGGSSYSSAPTVAVAGAATAAEGVFSQRSLKMAHVSGQSARATKAPGVASQALCVRRKSLAVLPPDEKQMRRMEGWRATSAEKRRSAACQTRVVAKLGWLPN